MKQKRIISEIIFIIIVSVTMLLQFAAFYYPPASLISPSEDIFGFFHESVHEMSNDDITDIIMEVIDEVGVKEVMVPTVLMGLLLLLKIQAVLFALLMVWKYIRRAKVQKWGAHGMVASFSFLAVSGLLMMIPYQLTSCIGDGGLELLGFGERFRPTVMPYITAGLAGVQIIAILIYMICQVKKRKSETM